MLVHRCKYSLSFILIVTFLFIFTWQAGADASIIVTPSSLQEQAMKGQTVTRPLTITNTGSTLLHYQFALNDLKYITYTPQTSAKGFPYTWTDISTTGILLEMVSNSDDGWDRIDLNFDFPYFGEFFRQVYVSTNGYLTLGKQAIFMPDDTVPGPTAPANLIAGFAKDLNSLMNGDVYYQQDSERLIIQYTNIPENTNYGPYTFQIVLERNGNITMFYKTMGTSRRNALIGLQNGTKDIGVSVPMADAESGEAIQFQPKTLWMQIDPMSGDLPPQSTVSIPVHFGAGHALARTYTSDILLYHNAANVSNPLVIPCTFTSMNQAPIAALAVNPLTPKAGEIIHFTAEDSSDPDGYVTSYTWDFDADGEYDDAVGVETYRRFDEPGVHPVSVQVADAEGDVTVKTVKVNVVSEAPLAILTYEPRMPQPGSPVYFDASQSYDPNGAIASYSWDLNGDGIFGDWEGVSAKYTYPVHGEYHVGLKLTDNENFTTTQTWVVPVKTNWPQIQISPTSLSGETVVGQKVTQSLNISNLKGERLDYNIMTRIFREKGDTSLQDAFGYSWIDSRSAGGPKFVWNDISVTGKALENLSYSSFQYQSIPLSFNFPFYGNEYKSVYVSPYGFVTFGQENYYRENQALPSALMFGNYIAAFHDKLVKNGKGAFYYLDDGEKVTIQYDHMKIGETDDFTFQIVLFRSGTILFYYKDIQGDVSGATAGIQNGDKTIGLTVTHKNATYISSGLAVQIQSGPQWLTLWPKKGSIYASPEKIEVVMSPTSLRSDSYRGEIVIQHNAVNLDSPIVIPVDFTIHNTPPVAEINVNPQHVYWGYPVTFDARTSYDLDGTIVSYAWDLNHDGQYDDAANATVSKTFTSLDPTPITMPVRLRVSDDDGGSSDVETAITVMAKPSIGLSQMSFEQSVYRDEPVANLITISNTGGSPLQFQMERIGNEPDLYHWSDSSMPGGPEYIWRDIAVEGTELSYLSEGRSVQAIDIGFEFPFYNNTYNRIYVSEFGYISFGPYTNSVWPLPLPHTSAPANMIAGLWQEYKYYMRGKVYYLDDGQRFIVQYQEMTNDWSDTSKCYTFQIVLERSGSIYLYYKTIPDQAPNAAIGIQNQAKTKGLTVANQIPFAHDGLAVRITNTPVWIKPAQLTGTVAPGEQLDIPIVFDALGFPTGLQTGQLRIISNDPDAMTSSISCTMNVLNAPPVPQITYTGLLASGEVVTFSGEQSTDRDSEIVSYRWDLNNDQVYTDATGVTVSHSFAEPGLYEIGLEVQDQEGVVNTIRLQVPIQNNAPKPIVTCTPQVADVGEETTLDASASYDFDGVITQFAWDLNNDQTFDAFGPIVKHIFAASGVYTIVLQLTDNLGAVTTHTFIVEANEWPKITLDVEQVDLTTDPKTAVKSAFRITNTGLRDLSVQLKSDYEVQRRKGGPDAGGYYWTDSEQADGVPFVWEDISLTGKRLQPSGSWSTFRCVLPFAFPYYGKPFYQVFISDNGYLSMGFSWEKENQSIPGYGVPNLIAGYFDDLTPVTSGSMYYLAASDRFVVQYEQVKVSGLDDTVTFQIVLEPDGVITYYYKDMVGMCNGATIGIQDETQTIGLQISHNQPFQKHNYAIRFEPMQDWLTLSSETGLVPPGESMEVTLDVNPDGIRQSRRTAELTITHNGNNRLNPITIPITLQLINEPPTATILQTPEWIQVGVPATFAVDARDRNGRITEYAWDVDGDGFDDGTGSSLTQTFASAGLYEIQVQVTDDAGGVTIATRSVDVQDLPQMGVSTLNIEASLVRPESANRLVTITNSGNGDLHYQITPWIASDPKADYTWKDSAQSEGLVFQWKEIRGLGTRLNVISDGLGKYEGVNLKFAFPFYGMQFDHIFVSSNGYITLSAGSEAYTAYPLPSNYLPSNLIAPILGGIYLKDGGNAYYLDEGDRVIIQFQRVPTSSGYITYQIVLERSGRIYFYYKEIVNGLKALIGIQDSTRKKAVQVSYNDANYLCSGLAVSIEPVSSWLNSTPRAGVIPAGQSAEVQVVLNTKNVGVGSYTGALDIYHPNVTPVQVMANLTASNQLPHAVIESTPVLPLTDELISFSGIASNDLDGTIVEYAWDFDGDEQYDDAVGATVSISFGESGFHSIGLWVKDNDGGFCIQRVSIQVANRKPTAAIRHMPSLAEVGQEVRFNASGSVDPDGIIVSYAWDLDQDDLFDDGDGVEVPYTFAAVGTYAVSVQVTDDDGDTNICTLPVTVKSWQKAVVEPNALMVTTGKNQAFQRTLTLANPGSENLTYTVDIVRDVNTSPIVSDQFGYYALDSSSINGPAYVWNSIARPETLLTQLTWVDDGSVLVNLPFAFPFYGESYNSMYVCTNGYVTFKTKSTAYVNYPFPHAGAPANVIAAFFKDLDLRSDSGVYYTADAERAIVQYENVKFGYPVHNYTFQIVLQRDGTILFYYKSMGNVLDASVGMQNELKNCGLTLAHNRAYLKNEFAVQIQRVNWLTRIGTSGAVPPGGQVEVLLLGDTQGKGNGQDQAQVRIQHNAQNAANPLLVPFDLVVENLLPMPTFTLPTSAYTNEPVTLDGSASSEPEGQMIEYAWDVDGDGFDDGNDAIVSTSFSQNGTLTVRLQVTDEEGGSQIAERSIEIRNRPPEAILTVSSDQVFPGTAVEIDLSQSKDADGTIVDYAWDLDHDGDFDDAQGVRVTHTFAVPGDYVIGGQVTDDDGDVATVTWGAHVVNRDPVAEYSGLPATAYLGDTLTLNASGSRDPDGSALTYAWDWDGDGSYDDGSSIEVQFVLDKPGIITPHLEVRDEFGGRASVAHTVEVINRKPTPQITFTPAMPNTYETVTFDGASSVDADGMIQSYAWDLDQDGLFHDGAGMTANRVYTDNGTYAVSLQVTDQYGASAVHSISLVVYNQGPVAHINASKTTVNLHESVELNLHGSTDLDGEVTQYTWDLDDDGSFDDATAVSITHAFSKPGIYTLHGRVTDDDGASQDASLAIEVINMAPKAVMMMSDDTPDQGQTVTLGLRDVVDDGTIVSYSWDLDGDGNFGDGIGETALWRSETIGTYEVRVKVIDDCGGETVVTRSIQVLNLNPVAEFSIQPEVIYSDSTVTLDASAAYDSFGAITLYEWDLDHDAEFDDATGKTITASITQVGFSHVSLRVTDADGGIGTKSRILYVQNTPPVAVIRFTPANPHTLQQITFNAFESTDKENGITSYAWDLNGDGTFGDQVGAEVSHSFPWSGQYTVGLEVRDIHGGIGVQTVTVNVLNQKPIARIWADRTVIKTGESVLFDLKSSFDNDGRIVQYEWDCDQDGSYDDGTGSTMIWTFDAEGTYTITGKVQDDEGAYGVATITITVMARIPTTVDIQPISLNPYPGEEVAWKVSCTTDPDTPIVSYAWDLDQDGEYDDGSAELASRIFTKPGLYLIKVRVTDVQGNWFFHEISCQVSGIRIEEYSIKADLDQMNIYWYSPDARISKVRLLRKVGGYSTTPTDGMLIYEGIGRAIVDKDQTPGIYYYTLFPYDANNRTYPVPLDMISIPVVFPKETIRLQPDGSNPYANVVMAQNWRGDIYTEWNVDSTLGRGNTGRMSDLWLYFPDLFGFGSGQIPLPAQIERAKLTLKLKEMQTSSDQPHLVAIYRITDPSGLGQPVVAEQSGPSTGISFLYRDGRPGRLIPWSNGAENIQSILAGVHPVATWEISSDRTAEMTFDITDAVRAWAQGEPNHGLYITVDGEWELGEQYTVLGPQAAVVTNRPLLEVVYNTHSSLAVPVRPVSASYIPWNGGVQLSWSGLPENAVGFRVVRSTERKPVDPYDGQLVYDGSANFCIDAELVDGVTYFYGIFAYDQNRVYSQGFSLTVVGGTLAPPFIEAVNPGPGYIDLRWTPVPGAAGYVVYRRNCNSGEISKVPTWQAELRDDHVMCSVYDYWVTAVNAIGESQPSGRATAAVPLPGGVEPLTPYLKVGQVSGSEITLLMDYPYGTTTAETVVERRVGEEWREVGRIPYNLSDFMDTGLQPNTMYEYRAISVNTAGMSGYTPSLTARTADELVFPGPFTWKIISASVVVLNWSDAFHEEGYVLEVHNAKGDQVATYYLNPDTTSYRVTGLSPTEGYYFTVSATRGSEVSRWVSDLVKTYNDPKRDIF